MKIKYKLFILNLTCLSLSCNKLIEIDPPTNTIVTEQVFTSDNIADKAILGLYSKFIDQSNLLSFGNSVVTFVNGLSSDESTLFGADAALLPFYKNQLVADNAFVLRLWQQPYEVIYAANACLEQLEGNKNLTLSFRDRLIGETKFIRAYMYFYLINYFGDVPFLTTSSYKTNSISPRVSFTSIYSEIINDLESSVNTLPTEYSVYGNERIRVTKWATLALLSRMYLYIGNWEKAESYANMVISNSNFSLENNLNDVFLKNSNEAIFQLAIDGKIGDVYNTLPEAAYTIPFDRTSPPFYFYLSNSFIGEFEPGDRRRTSWVDSTIYSSTTFYVAYKYKVGYAQSVPNSIPSEYYMILRLAEQYLIRSEAKAQKDDLIGAAVDINIIRARAGLGPITFSSKDDAIDKILEERKKEFFHEWGHRWFDLKRTGKLDGIMSVVTPQKGGTWQTTDKLFPIPAGEIFRNPNLIQNQGY